MSKVLIEPKKLLAVNAKLMLYSIFESMSRVKCIFCAIITHLRLIASEARHRLAPIEGQKENRLFG